MVELEKVAVVLTSEQLEEVTAAVDSGEYATVGEAIRAAVSEWQGKRELQDQTTERLRALYEEGLATGISNLTSEQNLLLARQAVARREEKAA